MLIPNIYPANTLLVLAVITHILYTRQTLQGDDAIQFIPCMRSQVLPHPHVSAHPSAYPCYQIAERQARGCSSKQARERLEQRRAKISLPTYPDLCKVVKINAFTGHSAAGAQSPGASGADRSILTTVNAQQVPPSPSVQQSPITNATPSTLGAAGSPLQTPRPLVANAKVKTEATGRRETNRVRSSIACSSCRRSKTKCDNDGIRDANGLLAPCRSCLTSKKKCDYEMTSTGSQPTRRESTATAAGDETHQKKRKRPAGPTATQSPYRGKSVGTLEDAHRSPLLTPKVWDELWAIYEKHYAMEFPFLHKRTFLGPLQKLPPVSSSDNGSSPQTHREHDPALLCAFLACTACFHPELIAQHPHAWETSKFYAKAAENWLDWRCRKRNEAAMQQIQAFLMLGYHEWNACEERGGYMLIQQGVGFAKMEGYMHDDEPLVDRPQEARSQENVISRRDRFIQQESRRRTFWSCFIMDRYLSVGKRRPRMIQLDDIRNAIQIPCSDKSFISGRAVRTRYFGETDREYAKRRQEIDEKALQGDDQQKSEKIEWEVREDDGMLGRYMFTLDLFIDVNKWANNGGRRSEPPNIGPWNPKTEYYNLDKRLENISEDLPEELRLNPINTENHIYGPPSVASRTYFMIHAVLMLCKTYLAPEYLPTFGYRVTKPQGPLDPPLVTEPLPVDQPDYWVEKAADCFEYVRDYASVLQSFKDRDLVVESPFMSHAIWRAAWAAMYCHWVPKMDPSNALSSKIDPSAWDITNQVLESMAKKFSQADRYTTQLARHSNFYKERWRSWTSNGGSPQSSISDNELHEYRTILETLHKQYGSLETDETYPKQPHNTPYSKLSRLEQEHEPEDPHSPATVFKTDGDEPRRSISTAPSISSGFTVVNPSSAVAPLHREIVTGQANGSSITQTSHEALPPRPPQQQTSTYSEQPPQYGQVPAYTYANGTSAFTQPIPQYAATPVPYTPGSRSTQQPDPAQQHILASLEQAGNVSVHTADAPWFENNNNNNNNIISDQNYYSANYFPFTGQMQMPYHMQDHQGSYDAYGNQNQWPGPG